MRECERASVRIAIKKANITNDLTTGAKSIYEWIDRMKDSNADFESVMLCYRKYIKRKEREKNRVLKWTRAMQRRIYYFYNVEQEEFWSNAKFCVDYLIDRLEEKALEGDTNIIKQNNQKVLDWLKDELAIAKSGYCVKDRKLLECVNNLNYLKNLVEKLED